MGHGEMLQWYNMFCEYLCMIQSLFGVITAFPVV